MFIPTVLTGKVVVVIVVFGFGLILNDLGFLFQRLMILRRLLLRRGSPRLLIDRPRLGRRDERRECCVRFALARRPRLRAVSVLVVAQARTFLWLDGERLEERFRNVCEGLSYFGLWDFDVADKHQRAEATCSDAVLVCVRVVLPLVGLVV
jgi:hypothetical protein